MELSICNSDGKLIKTLVDKEQNAGSYEVEFDAAYLQSGVSAKGGYASGVYLYQLKAGEFTATKKMILIK